MLKDLLQSTRSYRSFAPGVTIPQELLKKWVDATRLAPSGINLQVLKYRIVTDRDECTALLGYTKWAGKLKDLKLPPPAHEPTAYIVICTDESVSANAARFQKDVGICAEIIMLSATEDGFGGCMIGSFAPAEVKTLLCLPESLEVQLVLALGKPDEVVELTDLPADGDTSYYRTNGIHYVPKRSLEEILIDSPKKTEQKGKPT